MERKGQKDFFNFSSNDVNEFLDKIYPGLSAKVFRTYRASFLMHLEIKTIKAAYEKKTNEKLILEELKSS